MLINKKKQFFKMKRFVIDYDWDIKSLDKKNKEFELSNKTILMAMINKILDTAVNAVVCKKIQIDVDSLMYKFVQGLAKKMELKIPQI